MTSAIRLNHFSREILISKSFSKAAMNPNSAEYQDLMEVMNTHPNYRVSERAIKTNSNKKTYSGLTYQYMRNYILLHTTAEEQTEEMAKFEKLILLSKCQSKSLRYPTIKKWFLEKYPEVSSFGTIGADTKIQITN